MNRYLRKIMLLSLPACLLTGCAVPVKKATTSSVPMLDLADPQEEQCTTVYSCAMKIRTRIALHIPQNQYDPKLMAKVNFKLNQKAEVTEVKVIQGSGEPEFDQTVVRAIKDSFPMAELLRLKPETFNHFTNLNVLVKPE